MEFDLKWVHMARYELILRLDGALWLTIISKPLLTKMAMKDKHTKKHSYLILSFNRIYRRGRSPVAVTFVGSAGIYKR